MVTTLNKNINKAAETSIPKVTVKVNKYPHVPWWNEEIHESIESRKKYLSKYKRTKQLEDLIQFKKARAKARKLILGAKSDSWNNFLLTINTDTPHTEIWKNIKKLSNNKEIIKINALNVNDKLITEQEIKSEAFAQYYQEQSSDQNYPIFLRNKHMHQENPIQFTDNTPEEDCNAIFTKEELELNIRELKNNSTPFSDNIHNEMLKELPEDAKLYLLKIYNKMWNIPKLWKKADIIPIHESGKSKTEMCNYRPISLRSTMSKLFEKMIAKRLNYVIEKNNLLSNMQNGFRQYRSTLENLTLLDTEIKDAYLAKQYIVSLFLDIEKAFDRVPKHKILNQLGKWNINGKLPKYINAFLTDRHIRVRLGNCFSSQYKMENDIPQGSVLSCILFNIAINDLTENIP